MTVKDNLIAAKALIDTPEKWHRGSMGAHGCFCAMGAVVKVNGWSYSSRQRVRQTSEIAALTKALPTGFWDVAKFNDHADTTHADIMALFDRAIAAQEA